MAFMKETSLGLIFELAKMSLVSDKKKWGILDIYFFLSLESSFKKTQKCPFVPFYS